MTQSNANEQKAFLESYKTYMKNVLLKTDKELKEILESWRDIPSMWADPASHNKKSMPSPINWTNTRIKRPESVVNKILRKPSSFPDGLTTESIRKISDALGARIVVYFLANFAMVDKALRSSSSPFEISSEDPPVAYLNPDLWERIRIDLSRIKREDKESGYASIHYIVRLRKSEIPLTARPWFEIQVRTLVEDAWGEIEHILAYKPDKQTSLAVKKQFQIISSQLTAIDEHFNLLHEELTRFQEEVTYEDDDPLNAENLPAILGKAGIPCVQREIDGLLRLLNSRGVGKVSQLSLDSKDDKKRLDLIRSVFQEKERRKATPFEIVAAIGATHNLKNDNDIRASVATQIDFLNAWQDMLQNKTEAK
jgi:putative GTP pyrophosphokinase